MGERGRLKVSIVSLHALQVMLECGNSSPAASISASIDQFHGLTQLSAVRHPVHQSCGRQQS